MPQVCRSNYAARQWRRAPSSKEIAAGIFTQGDSTVGVAAKRKLTRDLSVYPTDADHLHRFRSERHRRSATANVRKEDRTMKKAIPRTWMNETSGVLKRPSRAFSQYQRARNGMARQHRSLAMRAYLRRWIAGVRSERIEENTPGREFGREASAGQTWRSRGRHRPTYDQTDCLDAPEVDGGFMLSHWK